MATKEADMSESLKFRYHGAMRHVDNVTRENGTVIGMEIRKSGKFSHQIKRYSVDKIEGELESTWREDDADE